MVSAQSFPFILALTLWGATVKAGQSAAPAVVVPSLTIQVAQKPALVMTEEDLMKMAQHTAKVKEHEAETTYTGVSLHEVLVRAGAPTGNQLHGRVLASYVLASAKDGYQAVFTLTEMDPGFTDDDILIADRANGIPLPETQGPFRLIVPHDKKPARSVRMLEKIELVQLRH